MRIFTPAGASLLAAMACASGSAGTAAASSAAAQRSVASGHAMIARVTAVGTSGTQLFRTVRLSPTDTPDEYAVTIELRGAKLGNKIPWSISTGQCNETSSMELGDRVQYKTIEASADGTARSRSTLKINLPEGETYHVGFYASPTDRERMVSCGPLVPA